MAAGTYRSAYSAKYPADSGSLPDEAGYLAPLVRSAVAGAVAGAKPEVLSDRWMARTPGQELWDRTTLSLEALTFVKRNGVWTSHRGQAPDGDRVVGGGYASPVTLTELDELLAAGLISSEDRQAAIDAAGVT